MNSFEEQSQFIRGKGVEDILDGYFTKKGWEIRIVTEYEERGLHLGDREFTKGNKSFFVEYKSGLQTYHSGNIFLETVSVDIPGKEKQGWVYTSRAKYIVYATLLNGCILVFQTELLRDELPSLLEKYEEKATSHNQNNGYNSRGLIIPLPDAKQLAYKVIRVSLGKDLVMHLLESMRK